MHVLYYCNTVGSIWWDWSLIFEHLPSVLWHCRLGHLTYNVFGGTLNLTQLPRHCSPSPKEGHLARNKWTISLGIPLNMSWFSEIFRTTSIPPPPPPCKRGNPFCFERHQLSVAVTWNGCVGRSRMLVDVSDGPRPVGYRISPLDICPLVHAPSSP